MNTKYLKKTKIVATLGPATSDKNTLLEMVRKGANVFRINFSHADYKDVEQRIKMIREINEEYGYATSILADLQGPKLRIGNVMEGSELKPGDVLTFTNHAITGYSNKVFMTYDRFAKDVKVGENILIDDGKLILKVIETNGSDEVKAETIQGGPLKSKKGVNLPNTKISLPALTEKDIRDAKFAIGQNVDWIALSFVRQKEDCIDLQKLISENSDHKIPIISKIEKPEALENLDEIMDYSDGLMVARGDLGVEIPMAEVPVAQKRIVQEAKIKRKPVIIATQMMETMINSLTPTRAEVNDVANSVMDGADAVMLSGETSVGEHPVQVIEKMTEIIQQVEEYEHISVPSVKPKDKEDPRYLTNIICYNAAKISNQIGASAICTLTHSGYTAFQISAYRPNSHILVFTSNRMILTMLNLLWGVSAFYYDGSESTDKTVIAVNNIAKNEYIVNPGDFVINLNSMPMDAKGMVNTLRVTTILDRK